MSTLPSYALDVTPAEHAWVIGNARYHQIAAYQLLGQLDQAFQELFRAQTDLEGYGNTFAAQIQLSHLTITILSGNLRGAKEASTQLVNLAQSAKLYEAIGWGFQTLGYIHYQWNDLKAAEQYFLKVLELRYQSAPAAQVHSSFGLAMTYQALDKHDEAARLVEETIEWAKGSGNPEMLLEAYSFASRLALLDDQVPNTESWAPSLGNTFSVMLLIEIPHLTLANALIARGTAAALEEATDLLNQRRHFVERTHNTWRLIEVLNLQALLHKTKGEREAALNLLQHAIELAYPGGFIRLFVDLGPQMTLLLAELKPEDKQIQQYIDQILAVSPNLRLAGEETVTPQSVVIDIEGSNTRTETSQSNQNLPEPLTDREVDVLQLLAQGQTDREIALQLTISPHTVNFHLKNIYAKLNVHGRRQAEKRAQELGLLLRK